MGVRLRDIPFYSQKPVEDWCGPVTLQMFIEAVDGRKIPRHVLVKLCKTRGEGTYIPELRAALRELGVEHRTRVNSSLAFVGSIIKETRKPVIVIYREPEDEDLHYALCVGLTNSNILLNDPWHGRGFRLPRDEFVRRWKTWNISGWVLWSP